ncbi:MAG: membrane protein insertase YidC [Marinifilaceae bacterium]|jgi:YidC/Oxa1 family membrane protein insertase|nr:membrane protein insertase YidC [Marinifilaceae bacterium]
MDKNTLYGLLIIGAILIGASYFNRPSEEQLAKEKKYRDSIALVKKQELEQKNAIEAQKAIETKTDSVQLAKNYGSFANNVANKDSIEFTVLENELIKLKVSNLGGKIFSVELKDYKTYDQKELFVWGSENNKFGTSFFAEGKTINTEDLLFDKGQGVIIANDSLKQLSMKCSLGENQYIEYKYSLKDNSYMLDFDINFVGMGNIIPRNTRTIALNIEDELISKEKGKKFENQHTALYYKPIEENVEYLSISGDDEEKPESKVKWIGFKQQFFSSVLIAKDSFAGVKLNSQMADEESDVLKNFKAEIELAYNGNNVESYPMQFYFGPNHYLTLKKYGKEIELQSLVDLGWKIFGWVNRFIVIPIFNFLENYIGSYGLIILILTIIIKLVLAPLTYRSYLSSAKMRVLKPQIDEINEKFPKDKAVERQQATMALYKKVGVNPLGGCLPMLVQFPILIAMFRFFPASIELRQESFLWASDLSSYDSIFTLPFDIPFYGDHVSLFCLLMAVTNLIYTRMNGQMTQGTQQMPGMQTMMYLMPVMLLVWFNNYASGLSYYYFIATLFTIVQTWAIRKFMVDDDKILAMLEENKNKPPKKKSGFQKRLEEAAKQRAKK